MIEEQQMGSQTLEILRQGVWASLTGGWFYDPHQDVFCNTFHLYIWLFLLCLPFTIYVYFPPTRYMWYFYCVSVTIVLAVIKLVNYGLHHMYDTSECIQEEVQDCFQEAKNDFEGIEMKVLTKDECLVSAPSFRLGSLASCAEAGVSAYTDADSVESTEFQQNETAKERKPGSTIDLKVDVHRKNSSESSDGGARPILETAARDVEAADSKKAKSERRPKHQRSKTDGFVSVTIKDEQKSGRSSFHKLYQRGSSESQDGGLVQHRPSLHSVESGGDLGLRYNFTNSSLNFLPSNVGEGEIKPTGSLELGYIDKNPGFFFKPPANNTRSGVRRIRSTALETCCPAPSLTVHPNSLEVIGGKSARNPLPPPSSSLVRNQHLNLCSYYGSEIVYPIAEQSDEHQTSHELESSMHFGDSDYEEQEEFVTGFMASPALDRIYITLKPIEDSGENKGEGERASATSKDGLLGDENSRSSATTPEMQDARADCCATDNDVSDKNLSCSNTSVECVDWVPKRCLYRKLCNILGERLEMFEDELDKARRDGAAATAAVASERHGRSRKRKRTKKRADDDEGDDNNSSASLVDLDLDWLFNDDYGRDSEGGGRLQRRKEPLKRENEWSSTTTVSLEHDVSKVLQETVPTTAYSLGAIPKKRRSKSSTATTPPQEAAGGSGNRRTPKSESEKCSMCRCKSDERESRPPNRSTGTTTSTTASTAVSNKENKITQTLRQAESPSPVEGLECLVFPQEKVKRLRIVRQRSKFQKERIEEASSSGSNNELSNLLPPPHFISAFLSRRQDFPFPDFAIASDAIALNHAASSSPPRSRLKRSRVHRRRPNQRSKRDNAIATSITAGHGTHSAKNFNDTTDGSVHCFMDEYGNWITYTFDEKGLGTANLRLYDEPSPGTGDNNNKRGRCGGKSAPNLDFWGSNESASVILDAAGTTNNNNNKSMIPVMTQQSEMVTNPISVAGLRETLIRRSMNDPFIYIPQTFEVDGTNNPVASLGTGRSHFRFIQTADCVNHNYQKTKTYYKFKVFPWTFVKIGLDRLKLLALLDRNLTLGETLLSVVLGVLVAILGACLLHANYYDDVLAFIFCFIMASCQYSLLKSVQPDAASPTHGFNRIIAYSRPIYFCLFSGLVLVLDSYYAEKSEVASMVRDFSAKFILFFPILLSLGLFPQINTFAMYLLEQVDMHVFGGNAMSSLVASFYCIFRSILAVLVMNGLAYGGLSEPKRAKHVLFSIFCACLVACSYHLSRSASDPLYVWTIIKHHLWPSDIYREQSDQRPKEEKPEVREKSVKFTHDQENKAAEDHVDPLPSKLQKTVNARLKNDVILCGLIAVLVFGIHASTVFTALQPELSPVLWIISVITGFVLHYVIPQLRKQLPWMCIARPVLRSREHFTYHIRGPAEITWFEKVYVYLCFVERNILYPLLFLSVLTEDAPKIADNFEAFPGSFILVICGLKCLRCSYSDQNSQYLILTFTVLFFRYDFPFFYDVFVIQYFFMSIIYYKSYELILKVQFVVTYIAPWQITWGSAFHAFAQPFSVPHSAMLFLQTIISALLSTPLNPFLGSAIFLTSYVRPVKFWERDYNTRRVDHSNTPLSSHLDRNLGADDNNLNSIFYEHLTRSLQHSLCGDLILGRWGLVNQGDCFVLASDYLNCLVHIIELGNGLVTFQMRGLEFRGTYCQQREVEAITEGIEDNDACCCVDTDRFNGILSVSSAFSQRWLAWEVTASKYILEGYSISDNSAISMLQVFEFRKVLISYYVKSIIFYTVRSPKLEEWLTSQSILKALQPMEHKNYVDVDPVFNFNIDEDYDLAANGMTRNVFCQTHGDWISYCVEKVEKNVDSGINSTLVLLCFALSLLGRRALGAVSHNTVSSVEFFLYGLHALFKGDFRITCARDEWVFTDMDLLKTVVASGVRMSLKLHQDHFMAPDEYEEFGALYEAICKYEDELVISHEGDPAWRSAVLSGTPSLLALRHVLDEGTDEYKIIMLNKRYLSFRVIKINKECVRGLWAGQQQELVYLRNRNPERGSIQNAKQALRNIINSSCDQPIGYPIYVSPLTTSYAETSEQYCGLVGGSVSFTKIKNHVLNLFRRIRKRCGEGCSSGASTREEIGMGHEGVYAMTPVNTMGHPTTGSQSTDGSHLSGSMGRGSSLSRTSLGGNRGSLVSVGKPTSATLASLAGLFKERDERAVSQTPDAQARADERTGDFSETTDREFSLQRVMIVDPNLVYDGINLGRRIDVMWPTEHMRIRGGRSFWKDWVPETGMEGPVVHKWTPCHRDPCRRSHVDRTILLVQIDDKFVPIAESGVQDLGQEV